MTTNARRSRTAVRAASKMPGCHWKYLIWLTNPRSTLITPSRSRNRAARVGAGIERLVETSDEDETGPATCRTRLLLSIIVHGAEPNSYDLRGLFSTETRLPRFCRAGARCAATFPGSRGNGNRGIAE